MSIEGCMDKEDVVYVYYSAVKKDKIMPCAATLMDLEIFILSENRKTNTIWYDLYVESKRTIQRTYLQNTNRLTNIESKFMDSRGGGGSDKLGVCD